MEACTGMMTICNCSPRWLTEAVFGRIKRTSRHHNHVKFLVWLFELNKGNDVNDLSLLKKFKLKCLPLDGAPSFLKIRWGVHQFLFTLTFANSMLIFCTFLNIHVVLRYLWNHKYSFKHSWIKIYVQFLLKFERLGPVLQLLPACQSLHCVMPHQHWTVNYIVHRARMSAHFSAGRVLENLCSRDRIGKSWL